jgi:hypothetical protein
MFKNLPSSFALLAAFFAALGTLFFVIGAHTFYRNCQFAGDVVRASGTVTDRYITYSHSRHGGTSTHYHVAYHFYDTAGFGYVTNVSVVSDTYYGLSAQGPVPVKYLPHFPTINRIDLPAEDRNYESMAWAFLTLGGIFGGFGWYSFIELERLIFYRRWLRRFGLRRAGTVDRIETNFSLTINQRNPRYLVYSYTDATGQKHQDSSPYLSLKQEELWKEGDCVDVFCDPRDPSRSTVNLDGVEKGLNPA